MKYLIAMNEVTCFNCKQYGACISHYLRKEVFWNMAAVLDIHLIEIQYLNYYYLYEVIEILLDDSTLIPPVEFTP